MPTVRSSSHPTALGPYGAVRRGNQYGRTEGVVLHDCLSFHPLRRLRAQSGTGHDHPPPSTLSTPSHQTTI